MRLNEYIIKLHAHHIILVAVVSLFIRFLCSVMIIRDGPVQYCTSESNTVYVFEHPLCKLFCLNMHWTTCRLKETHGFAVLGLSMRLFL